MTTDCELFWASDFGDQYTRRCRPDWLKRARFWRDVVSQTGARSILEVGCNSGWNLSALRLVNPKLDLHGFDVNASAIEEARQCGLANCEVGTIDHYRGRKYDLVFTSGVLIHVAPADLAGMMKAIAEMSYRHVVAIEYPSEVEQEIDYRGHQGKLWKRPFGKLYEKLGLRILANAPLHAESGFNDCHFWLMEKP